MKRSLLNSIVVGLLLILGSVTVANAQPANDNCANATPIIIPTSGTVCSTGTLAGATDDGTYTACETAGSKEVWFTYIVSGANNTITVTPNGGTPATNLVVSLSDGGCASNLVNTCNAAATANGAATVNRVYPVGTQVWIFISSAGGTDGGFQVCVSSVTTPASTGKDCNNAAPICNLNSFTVPVASGSNGFQPPCFNAGPLQQPIIFKFTVGVTGILNWLATPSCGAPNANNTEFDWAVYDVTSGCPGTIVKCNYNYTGMYFPPFINIPPNTTPQGMQPGATNNGCSQASATGSNADEICQGVTVTADSTYIIIIDQYTLGSSCSINMSFAGSTFQLAPLANFSASPATGCGNTLVSFTNTSTASNTYHWNFGRGPADTSNVQNPPPITYGPGSYLISLTTTSPSGCSDVHSQSIQINPIPTVSVNNASICGGSGLSATLTATPSLPGGTYLWSPGGATSQSISVTPATTTTYTVTYTRYACTATATATVTISTPNFTVDAGPAQTICANQSVQLQPVISAGGAPYTYQWSPATFMASGGDTTKSPFATPLQTTNYLLSVTDVNGCTLTDSVLITVSGVGPLVTPSVTPSVICAGQQVQLDFSSLPLACGISGGCAGTDKIDSVGPGYSVQNSSNTTTPTVYGNFYKSTRMQMLYTAAELSAAFGTGGTIKALAWEIGTFNSNATLQNFTIRIGCLPTTTTSLSTWQTGLTTVYTAATYTPITGWNNHNLNTYFDWDGASNLVVEICYYNPSNNGSLVNMMAYNTVANGVIYAQGNTDLCSTNPVPTQMSQRPKLRMRLCQPNYALLTINWTPATGSNAVSNAAIRNPTANPLSTQTYQVTATQGGCPGSGFITVTVDTAKVRLGPDITSCPNQQVTLTATLPPGATPRTFQWKTIPSNTNIGTGATINVNPNTNTTYVVTALGGPCAIYDTVNIIIGPLTVTHTATNGTCNGANNGKIKLLPAGTAPYTVQWSANAATGNVDSAVNLAPGTYYATVTDANGCSGTDNATITQPTAVTFTQTVTNVTCNAGTNGQIAVTPSGGTGPTYTYSWSNGLPATATVTGLAANTYTVTVYDANQCTATGTFTVTQPTAVTVNTVLTKNIRCYNGNDGAITVSGAGGTGPTYTYTWSNGLPSTASVSNLTAGTYTVTVKDVNNCSATATFTLTQPANGLTLPTPTFVPVTCNGGNNGTATAHPVGGATPYIYLWSNTQATQSATGLSAGSYTVTVTDDSLCTASSSVNVTQPPAIQIAGNVTDVLCNGNSSGAIDITLTNGVSPFSYQWSNTANTQDLLNVAAGTYTVTVSDLTSCTQTATYTVTQPTALTLNAPTITNVSCFGGNNGSITANPAGGVTPYAYTWSPSGNSQTISGLSAGTYPVTVNDANGCSITNNTYQVTEPATAVAFGTATITNVLCNSASTGAITVNVSGGTPTYHYSWSHNAGLDNATASSLLAGAYTVTATDANGCTVTQSNTVTQPAAITFGTPIITNASCNGATDGVAEVTPTGGTGAYSYTWNGIAGTNPQSGLAANTYNVVVTDSNNCAASTNVVITEPGALIITLTPTDVSCFGGSDGSISSSINGGTPAYTYLWSDNNNQTTATATNLMLGAYIVTITDSRGCSASAATNVFEPGQLTVSATSTQVSCFGSVDGTITANALGGSQPFHYSLNFGGATVQDNYTGSFTGLNSGSYIVNVEDDHLCPATTTVNVAAPVQDFFDTITEPTSCYGTDYTDGVAHIQGTTIVNLPFLFAIDGGPQQYSGDFYNLSAGQHIITATNNFGCVSTIPVTVGEPVNGYTEILPDDTTIQLGETIQLHSTFGPYAPSTITSYAWSPLNGLSCIDCPNPYVTPYNSLTEYTLTVTYNDHCKALASMTVLVENKLPVYIPNAFSPNGDGNNDVFKIYGEGIKTLNLKIFNRWGEKIFESTNQFIGWDGTYKGVIQNPGVYIYELSITYLDDKQTNKTGSITIIK